MIDSGPREGRVATQAALWLLANIDDPTAAPALRQVLAHTDAGVRAAAVRSLAWSGAPADVGRVALLLSDSEPTVRSASRAALAELGGQAAADALFATVDRLDDDERGEVDAALAWLGDARDLDATRRLAHASLGDPVARERGAVGAIYALVRLGEPADRRALVETMMSLAGQVVFRVDPAAPNRVPVSAESHCARMAAERLDRQLRAAGFTEEADRASDAYHEQLIAAGWVWGYHRRHGDESPALLEPLRERSVPRLAMRELRTERPSSSEKPPAKFGGQPDWLETPAWPLSEAERPLVFYGQLPLVGSPQRFAYIFINLAWDAKTWEPLSDGNAVIVQPGAAPQLSTAEHRTAPGLFDAVSQPGRYRQATKFRRYERFVTLEPSLDPPAWSWPEPEPGSLYVDDPHNWRKIAGTPLFLQGEDWPAGDSWQFAFQFDADWAGHELGDGAVCYGFVDDGGRGAMLWQCH